MLIKEAEQAKTNREQTHVEFDSMTYQQYWESNAKAANGYIYPKINKQDVRITTGTTREKKNTLLSNLINYDFTVNIEAYDKDDHGVIELGDVMADLVRKSRDLEKPIYDEKQVLYINELLNQGNVCIEDNYIEYTKPDRNIIGKLGNKLDEMTWTNDKPDQDFAYCNTEMIVGLNVYFGDIRQPNIEMQPYIFTRKLISRAQAEAMYGQMERWQHVSWAPKKIIEDGSDTKDFNNWTLETYEFGLVEVLKYYNPWTNCYMLMLNGVPMFPVRRDSKNRLATIPLSSLTGKCEYPLSWTTLEPISSFVFGKSIPAKTKVDQQVFDEWLRLLILKTRKSFTPPRGNLTGYTLSKSIDYPGTVHDGINPEKIPEIGTNTGVTQSEMNAIQFLQGIIADKSITSTLDSATAGKKKSAKEAMQQQQQAQLKMGLAILAVMNMERQLAHLRILNILKYWTSEDGRVNDVKTGIKDITVDATLDDGEKGKRVIRMTSGKLPHPQQIAAEEKLRKDVTGKKVKVNYVNKKDLARVDLKWYIEIVPEAKNSGDLKAAMFEETAVKLLEIAPELVNKEYIVRKMALNAHIDPDKLINKPQAPQPGQPPQGGQPQPGQQQGAPQGQVPNGGMAAKVKPNGPSKPTINTMQNHT